MVLLFAFLAGVYTLSELKDEKYIPYFTRIAKRLIAAMVIVGALVFVAAELSGHNLFREFYQSPFSVASIILATIALPFLWINLDRQKPNLLRILAGFQTTMIVTGWFAIQFPVLVKLKDGGDITFYNASAPEQTQFYLFIALVVGVLIVFPSMFYLYKTFKFEKSPEK